MARTREGMAIGASCDKRPMSIVAEDDNDDVSDGDDSDDLTNSATDACDAADSTAAILLFRTSASVIIGMDCDMRIDACACAGARARLGARRDNPTARLATWPAPASVCACVCACARAMLPDRERDDPTLISVRPVLDAVSVEIAREAVAER